MFPEPTVVKRSFRPTPAVRFATDNAFRCCHTPYATPGNRREHVRGGGRGPVARVGR